MQSCTLCASLPNCHTICWPVAIIMIITLWSKGLSFNFVAQELGNWLNSLTTSICSKNAIHFLPFFLAPASSSSGGERWSLLTGWFNYYYSYSWQRCVASPRRDNGNGLLNDFIFGSAPLAKSGFGSRWKRQKNGVQISSNGRSKRANRGPTL